jgi:hypothetical protein
MYNTADKLIEHVYGTYGYSKLLIDGKEYELNWSINNDGTWNYSTNNPMVIKAFNDTF